MGWLLPTSGIMTRVQWHISLSTECMDPGDCHTDDRRVRPKGQVPGCESADGVPQLGRHKGDENWVGPTAPVDGNDACTNGNSQHDSAEEDQPDQTLLGEDPDERIVLVR